MEAVCPQCQMRYEVGEELLQQATPVLCPSCQVGLTFVEPGTNIPLDPQPGAAQPVAPGPQEQVPVAGDAGARPGAEEQAAPAGAASRPPPGEPDPAGPGSSWNAGELLWGDTARGSDTRPPPPDEPPAAPAAAPVDAWGSLETEQPAPPAEPAPTAQAAPPVETLQPAQPVEDAVPAEQETARPAWAETAQPAEPLPPSEPVADAGQHPGAPGVDEPQPEQAEEALPSAVQDQGFPAWTEPTQAGEPGAEPVEPAPPAASVPAAEQEQGQPAWTGLAQPGEPGAEPVEPAPPAASVLAAEQEQGQPAWTGPARAGAPGAEPVEPVASAAPPAQPAAAGDGVEGFQTPAWGGPGQPTQDEVEAAGQQPAADPWSAQAAPAAEPGQTAAPPAAAGMDDWASAAAQWAASGFAADQMPGFVKSKDQAGPSTALPPAGDLPQAVPGAPEQSPQQAPGQPADRAPVPEPAPDSTQPPEQPEPVAALPEIQPQQPPAPPPLPRQEIELPSPQAPPPLEGKRKSTYIMRGSGEGHSEEAPWAEAPAGEVEQPAVAAPTAPTARPPAQGVAMQLPTVVPGEAVPPAEPEKIEVPKPKRTGLWVFLVIVLLAAGGFAAWYFHKQSLELDQGTDDTSPGVDRADIGAGGGTPGQPRPAPGPALAPEPDAGAADAGAVTATAEDASGPKDEGRAESGKQPAGDERPAARKKKRRKRRRDVAVRDKPEHDSDRAKNLYKKGNALIRKRKYKDAIKFFRQALRADPRFALAHRGLGICYAQLRKNKAACKSYRLYLKMIPPDSKEVPALKQILKSCK